VSPPAWARVLAEWCVRGPQREFELGDLEEMYSQPASNAGLRRATMAFVIWSLRSGAKRISESVGAAGTTKRGLMIIARETTDRRCSLGI